MIKKGGLVFIFNSDISLDTKNYIRHCIDGINYKKMKSGYFKSFDQGELLYRVWNYQKGQKALVVLHR
ncbi:MAG: methyltransferase, partial [Sphingobacterium sp.]|nr:methyltransferase [Sphingobacterium sp.]